MSYKGKQEHPGWAFQTKEGNWVAYAHGYFVVENAFYAKMVGSEKQAREELKYMQEDFEGGIECDIVPAWEPLCGKLRFEVKQLEDANKIRPEDLTEVWLLMEQIKSLLKLDE